MSDLSPEQHELLARVVAGDVARDSDAVRAAMNEPAFAEALMNLHNIQSQLDSAGRAERSVLTRADATVPTVRPDLVADTIRRLAAAADEEPARRVWRVWPIAAVLLTAAAALVSWLMLRGEQGNPNPRDREQLGATLQVSLAGLAGDTLRWTCVPPAARYVVTVFDPEHSDQPILDSRDLLIDLRQPEWSLDAEQRNKLAAGQHWRVEAFRPGRSEPEGAAQGPLQLR